MIIEMAKGSGSIEWQKKNVVAASDKKKNVAATICAIIIRTLSGDAGKPNRNRNDAGVEKGAIVTQAGRNGKHMRNEIAPVDLEPGTCNISICCSAGLSFYTSIRHWHIYMISSHMPLYSSIIFTLFTDKKKLPKRAQTTFGSKGATRLFFRVFLHGEQGKCS